MEIIKMIAEKLANEGAVITKGGRAVEISSGITITFDTVKGIKVSRYTTHLTKDEVNGIIRSLGNLIYYKEPVVEEVVEEVVEDTPDAVIELTANKIDNKNVDWSFSIDGTLIEAGSRNGVAVSCIDGESIASIRSLRYAKSKGYSKILIIHTCPEIGEWVYNKDSRYTDLSLSYINAFSEIVKDNGIKVKFVKR